MKPRDFFLVKMVGGFSVWETKDRAERSQEPGPAQTIHVREVMPDERGPFKWDDPDVLKGAVEGYKEQLEEALNRIKILENHCDGLLCLNKEYSDKLDRVTRALERAKETLKECGGGRCLECFREIEAIESGETASKDE